MSQTTALAPRLPSLLETIKEELRTTLVLNLDPVKLEAKAQHVLMCKLAADVKSSAEQIAGYEWYEPDSLPVQAPVNIAKFRVAAKRLTDYLAFRDTLDRYRAAQEEAARTLAEGNTDEPDVTVE